MNKNIIILVSEYDEYIKVFNKIIEIKSIHLY